MTWWRGCEREARGEEVGGLFTLVLQLLGRFGRIIRLMDAETDELVGIDDGCSETSEYTQPVINKTKSTKSISPTTTSLSSSSSIFSIDFFTSQET
jgi:hypothetical protein